MIKKWNRIKKHLNDIDHKIPKNIMGQDYYLEFKKYLDYNELQLSLESVLELILINQINKEDYWWIINNMNAAAREMELEDIGKELENLIITFWNNHKKVKSRKIKPNVLTRVKLLETKNSGRILPVANGYRGIIYLNENDNYVIFEFIDKDLLFPGDEINSRIEFASKGVFLGNLKIEDKFEIMEGNNLVGKGIILQILS